MTFLPRAKFALLLFFAVAIVGCAVAHREAGGSSAPTPDKGYVLITIKSDMQGVLPFKPDSFWGIPLFIGLEPERHYLLQMKSGGYSFGALTVNMKIGRGTYNNTPFFVDPGKVLYLGEHRFLRGPENTFSWDVLDNLEQALQGLPDTAAKEIAGLPVERKVPRKKLTDL